MTFAWWVNKSVKGILERYFVLSPLSAQYTTDTQSVVYCVDLRGYRFNVFSKYQPQQDSIHGCKCLFQITQWKICAVFRICIWFMTLYESNMKDQKRCKGEREGRERIEDTKRVGWDFNACWPLQMPIILCWQAEDHFEPSTRGLLLPSSLQKSHTHTHTLTHTHSHTYIHTHKQITERSLTGDSPIRGIKKVVCKNSTLGF